MIKRPGLILLFILFATYAYAASYLNTHLNAIVADTLLDNARIGVAIYDITADSEVYEADGEKLLIPASNLKLFTSAAALELLGPSFKFETRFKITGSIGKDSTLNGNLVIVGGGDPLISGRFRDYTTEILEYWADSLLSRGIKEINGNILVDNSFFAPPELGPGWSWDDLSYWYACPVTSLGFNDNCVDLKFLPGKTEYDKAIIELNPSTDYIKIDNQTMTYPTGSDFTIDYYRIPNTNEVTVFGEIAIDDTSGRRDYVSVDKPGLYCATIFRDVLISRGIKVFADNVTYYKIPPITMPEFPLFTWRSDSLPVIIRVINKNSQNLFAEMTLKSLGAIYKGEGSFKAGIAAVDSFFGTIGITERDLTMHDGSGLSYTNQVKPDAIIRLLKYMSHSKNYDVYYASLGNPAEDRSLRKRLKDIPGRDKVRAKGGYIMNVSTLSGYLTGPRDGHLYAFSIMVNNFTCPNDAVELWQDRLLEILLKEF